MLVMTLLLAHGVPARADAFDHAWCVLAADDFRLVTDLPSEEARALARRLQRFREAVEPYLPGTPFTRDPPTLTIVRFAEARDFRRATRNRYVGGFMRSALARNRVVAGPGDLALGADEPVLHEYVHYLLRRRRGVNLPPWFDEGLAGVLSTAEFARDAVVVGELPTRALRRAIRGTPMRLPAVLDAEDFWDWHPVRRRAFYAWSWAFVHRLLLGREVGLEDRRAALEAYLGGRGPIEGVLDNHWRRTERALMRYLDRRAPTESHRVARPPLPAGFGHCLGPSERVRELVLSTLHHNADEAVARLRERLVADPDDAGLWMTLSKAEVARDNKQGAVKAARRARRLAPSSVSAVVQLAHALTMGCIFEQSPQCREHWQEVVPLLRDALARDPTRVDAVFSLGLSYLYSGRPGQAMNYLRIAYAHQPWAPHINFYLGECYRLVGDARAREHLQRSRRWSSTEVWRRLAEQALDDLES